MQIRLSNLFYMQVRLPRFGELEDSLIMSLVSFQRHYSFIWFMTNSNLFLT